MTGIHIALGVAHVVVNLAAGLYGAWAWWRDRPRRLLARCCAHGPARWPSRRRALGGVLLLEGKRLPRLHLIYGLVPLGVAFVAEQLRSWPRQTELDRARRSRAAEAVAAPAPRTTARSTRESDPCAESWASWQPLRSSSAAARGTSAGWL